MRRVGTSGYESSKNFKKMEIGEYSTRYKKELKVNIHTVSCRWTYDLKNMKEKRTEIRRMRSKHTTFSYVDSLEKQNYNL